MVKTLEEVRQRYHFVVVGYVVMPEPVHLLLGEPERGNPSVVMQVLKQRYARALLRKTKQPRSPLQGSLWEMSLEPEHVWQRRFYDFVVWSQAKIEEKIRYMHGNPVKRAWYGLPNNGAGAVRGRTFWEKQVQCGSMSGRQWNRSGAIRNRKQRRNQCGSPSPSAHPPKNAEGGATMVGSCDDKRWASPLQQSLSALRRAVFGLLIPHAETN